MKPLPFDMTPLTRSLNLAPAPRPVSRPGAATTDPHIDATTGSGGDAGPGRADPGRPSVTDVKHSTVEFPAEFRPARAARGEAAPTGDPHVDAPQKQAAQAAAEAALAERSNLAPAAELRTASYPRHLKIRGGWTARLAAEQIHALATHILARHTERNLRTLAVTSALAGEGKTTVTLALAEKLAAAGKRILVIDLDAHRATLSHECSLDDAAGVLQSSDPRDPTNLEFHSYSSDVPGVSIMPAGYPEHGDEGPPIVSPVHVGVLVLRGLEDYDMILLDCPPLLPVADTHVIGEVVDKALLVVRAGSTPRDMIDQAIDEFGRDKFLGAVLNRTRPKDIPYFREVYGYYRRDSARG